MRIEIRASDVKKRSIDFLKDRNSLLYYFIVVTVNDVTRVGKKVAGYKRIGTHFSTFTSCLVLMSLTEEEGKYWKLSKD